jgi:hypothetical protein
VGKDPAVPCRAVPCRAVRCMAWHGMAAWRLQWSTPAPASPGQRQATRPLLASSHSARLPAQPSHPAGRARCGRLTAHTRRSAQTERRRQRRCRADPSSAATPRVPIRTEGWRQPAEHGMRIHARALCRLMITPSELIEHPIEPTLASSRTGISGVENASSTTRRCATG